LAQLFGLYLIIIFFDKGKGFAYYQEKVMKENVFFSLTFLSKKVSKKLFQIFRGFFSLHCVA
jgi:hypothetical protein